MSSKSSIDHCLVLNLGKVSNRAGNITIAENDESIPFSVKRVYYLYDIPSGEIRGGHGHKALFQLLVAASGSFEVILDDGLHKKRFRLTRPDEGLLIVPGIWRDIENFSSGSICLVLASMEYTEGDYIRNYKDYLNYKSKKI